MVAGENRPDPGRLRGRLRRNHRKGCGGNRHCRGNRMTLRGQQQHEADAGRCRGHRDSHEPGRHPCPHVPESRPCQLYAEGSGRGQVIGSPAGQLEGSDGARGRGHAASAGPVSAGRAASPRSPRPPSPPRAARPSPPAVSPPAVSPPVLPPGVGLRCLIRPAIAPGLAEQPIARCRAEADRVRRTRRLQRNGRACWPAARRAALRLRGVGEVLGVRPGHVPGPHRGAGRHLHRRHEIILSPDRPPDNPARAGRSPARAAERPEPGALAAWQLPAAVRRADGQKLTGHQGARSQDMAAESCRTALGRPSVTSPAVASAPTGMPPR